MEITKLPETLLEAVTYFSDESRAHDFFVAMRWPEGVRCAHCQSPNVGKLCIGGKPGKERRVWNCGACKMQFTAKTGSVCQDSPIPFSKWMPAFWLVVNAKNGISSCELARALGITQKSAWHLAHRVRASVQRGGGVIHDGGVVQVDESWIGGNARFMHHDVRERKGIVSGSTSHKTPVMALLHRHEGGSRVIAHVPKGNPNGAKAMANIRKYVLKGAEIHSDESTIYNGLSPDYVHKVVNHAERYVQDGVHTNNLENFWTLLKRTIRGTHVHCAPFHLHRYLDDQTFRFNERKEDDLGRFLEAVKTAAGRLLTWAKLTAKEERAREPRKVKKTPKYRVGKKMDTIPGWVPPAS